MADTVEKVRCGAHAEFLRAIGAFEAVGREGSRQSIQDRRAIFLAS